MIFEWIFKNKRYIVVRRSRTALSGTRTIFFVLYFGRRKIFRLFVCDFLYRQQKKSPRAKQDEFLRDVLIFAVQNAVQFFYGF